MDRIVLDETVHVGKEIIIEGPPLEALRFQGARGGSLVTLTDASGNDFRGRVVSLSEETASVVVFHAFPSRTESPLEIVLLQALPEKERMELIIQKVTELGVSAIVPFKSERSISLKERESKQKKAHRWQEIAIRAVQQSRRARVPIVEEYRSFKEAVEACEDGLKIMLWEKEGENLKNVLTSYSLKRGPSLSPFEKCDPSAPFKSGPPSLSFERVPSLLPFENVSLLPPCEKAPSLPPFGKGGLGGFEGSSPSRIYTLVGPEGGFTEGEVMQAKERGFVPVKLGQRILRTETAAITLVGILQYELGDLS